jgi:LysR family transcriptional regulator for bpeEF and oprC
MNLLFHTTTSSHQHEWGPDRLGGRRPAGSPLILAGHERLPPSFPVWLNGIMDRIDLMRLFVRICETRSFSQTAREFKMTQPTISKRLQALETALGTRLAERNTRGLRPTAAGTLYYDQCKRWLAEMEDVEEQLSSQRKGPRGPLRLSLPVSLGQVQLARIALAFQRLHPGIQLDLSLSDRLVDLVEEGIDVAVRIGRVGNTLLVARPLARYRPLLVASPSYLERHGSPTSMAELRRHRILYFGVRDEAISYRTQQHIVPRDRDLVLDDPLALREAILEGIAIGLISPWLVQTDLTRQKLVQVLPEASGEEFPVHAVHLPSRTLPARIRAFVAYLSAEVPRIPGMSPTRAA